MAHSTGYDTADGRRATRGRRLVSDHALLTYYALAFVISWGAIVVVAGPGGLVGTGATIFASGVASLTGPSIAGLVLTGVVDGRAGYRRLLSRLLRWQVGRRWYLVALLTGPAVMAATAVALSAADPAFVPAIASANDKAGLLLTGIAAGAFVPVFEELGWTGFAAPRLLARHGVLPTGAVMGFLWGLWHVPFFAGTIDPSGAVPGWMLVAVLLFGWLPPYRVLIVWLYARTGSLLLAILTHAPIVAAMYVLADDASGAGLALKVLLWGAALWVIALVLPRSSSAERGPSLVARREVAA